MMNIMLRTMLALCFVGVAFGIELTIDSPPTLIGTNSSDYTIAGLSLDMSLKQVKKLVAEEGSWLLVKDKYNKKLYYIYSSKADGSKDETYFSLLWEKTSKGMVRLTVFPEYSNELPQNNRKLLTFDVVNDTAFKRKFLGKENRSAITLDLPSLGMKHTTYFYDDIGLEVIKKQSAEGDSVVFGITAAKR